MKVLHVYKTYYSETFGGVEQVMASLCKGLLQDGIASEVFCLSTCETKVDVVDGITVHRIKSDITLASTPLSLKAFKKLKKIAEQFDIIHYHFPYPFADILHFAAGINKPTVVTYHSDIVKQKFIYPFYRPLMYRFLKRVDHIVATSPAYIKTSPVLSQFKKKTTVIPIGIDEKNYPMVNEASVAGYKQKFGKCFFAFVGVLRYYKGLHILIEAVRHTDIHVVIAGAGLIETELKQQASGLANVHFLGAISDQEKVDLLNACYGFVFPSHLRSEAFGISLLEAAMYKKPLISCEIGTGTSYINENNMTGIVVEPANSAALRKAMQLLLEDCDHANEMGKKAYARYKSFFARDQMMMAYKHVYEKLVQGKSNGKQR